MDEQTLVILAIQLTALTGIVGSLLLYLLCKVRTKSHTYDAEFPSLNVGTGRSVLLTSCDTGFGLQLALHLSALGFRVFAGFKPAGDDDGECGDSDAVKILRARLKAREAATGAEGVAKGVTYGSTITLPLDVTREDSLHEAVNVVRRHLPAGEDGLWAVINTAGVCYKGRLDQQDSCHWDAMLKVNVIGTLRTSRAFLALLRNKQGRLINLGAGADAGGTGGGLVAYAATRQAVAGAAAALRAELGPLGVRVITLNTDTTVSDRLFLRPRVPNTDSETTTLERYLKCSVQVVPDLSLEVVEEALLSPTPKPAYTLPLSQPHNYVTNYMAAITDRFAHLQCKKKAQETVP